jgi:hypothetical protein
MIFIAVGVALLICAGLFGWVNFHPNTSWHGLDPDTAESMLVLPFVLGIIGVVLLIVGLS